MDHRDIASNLYKPFKVDETNHVITLTTVDDEEISLKLEWAVCGTCKGNGTHVNPSIDSNGLSSEDFQEDPDFFEYYRNGVYDISCAECGGKRVVPSSSDPRFVEAIDQCWIEAEQDARTYAAECGGY